MSKLYKSKHISITFSASVENHKGMEIISVPGMDTNKGFSVDELKKLEQQYKGKCEYICLNDLLKNVNENDKKKIPEAGVLIFRNGLKECLEIDQEKCFEEQIKLNWDKHAFMYGRVVNKHARWNLCYADFNQSPDYENKRGTIINFDKLPILSEVRKKIGECFGSEFENLFAEGNYYYNTDKTYIGFHGDAERSKIIAIKLGDNFPLYYRWFFEGKMIENSEIEIPLKGGDIYIMSEKAGGKDWKKKKIYTLRHAAGNKKFLK
jgi:hypothetical protein